MAFFKRHARKKNNKGEQRFPGMFYIWLFLHKYTIVSIFYLFFNCWMNATNTYPSITHSDHILLNILICCDCQLHLVAIMYFFPPKYYILVNTTLWSLDGANDHKKSTY